MEYIDLYDENGRVIVTSFNRDDKIPEGAYKMAVGIWLMDDSGRLLITKRSPQKKFAPNLWENTGGHVMTGENPEEAIIRELGEETGIEVKRENIVFLGDAKVAPYLGKNYGVKENFSLDRVKLQEGETCDVRAITPKEFEKMAKAGEFAPSVVSHLMGYKENFFKFIGQKIDL